MLSRFHRRLSYLILGLLLISGIVHFVLHDYFPANGPFGPSPNPLEPWMLRLHGAAAMLTLLLVGSLLPTHVVRLWTFAPGNRRPGGALLLVTALLVVSGYGLYYFGGEHLRAWCRQAHLLLGLGAVPVFALHVLLGRATRHSRVPPIPGARRRPA
jgi:hypothetical protein